MKIIMPMAGKGSRLGQLTRDFPKPLVPVAGRPMLAWAMDSVRTVNCDVLIAIVQAEHDRRFRMREIIRASWPESPVEILTVDAIPPGQLCTVLAAREFIDGEDVLIISSDTLVKAPLTKDITAARKAGLRGLISVAPLAGDKWSFVRLDSCGKVIEVAEKRRISDIASTGVYWLASGREFLAHADKAIHNNSRINNEFYIMPVYEQYLAAACGIGISLASTVLDMGEPQALIATERTLSARQGEVDAATESGSAINSEIPLSGDH